jgi:hypothetical protein
MYIIYEWAVCLLAVAIGVTLLFTVYVMFLVLKEGGSILAQTSRKFVHGAIQLNERWMAAKARDS